MPPDTQPSRSVDQAAGHALVPQPCQLVIFGARRRPVLAQAAAGRVQPQRRRRAAVALRRRRLRPARRGQRRRRPRRVHPQAAPATASTRFSRQPLDEEHWDDFARACSSSPAASTTPAPTSSSRRKLEARRSAVRHPRQPRLLPRRAAAGRRHVRRAPQGGRHGQRRRRRRRPSRASSSRSRSAATWTAPARSSTHVGQRLRRSRRPTASTTTSARRRCRTCWCCASPTASSSRCGTRKYIDHVQITVAEEEGLAQYDHETGEMIASRVGYYEGVGALRDMVQNHMLQVLCLVAMEPPWSLDADVVRDAKVGVLHCLRPMTPADVEQQRRARPVHRGRRARPARARLPHGGARVFRSA